LLQEQARWPWEQAVLASSAQQLAAAAAAAQLASPEKLVLVHVGARARVLVRHAQLAEAVRKLSPLVIEEQLQLELELEQK
jgi:hypothetical protein